MVNKIENISHFNTLFHQSDFHPLVSVGNLADADLSIFNSTDFGMYCVILMESDFGELFLRGSRINYQAGTIVTMKPGQIFRVNIDKSVQPRGIMLAFRPELLVNTGLGRDFYMFNFFDYEVLEALDLYEGEHRTIINCFNNIVAELKAPDDEFTSHMVRLGIGQLLSYCRRFYDHQFDTKKARASELVKKLDNLLDRYLEEESGLPQRFGPPQVAWCSAQFNLSANYFGDLVKQELGMTARRFIQNKIVVRAKTLLSNQQLSINEVATKLGFAYPNHFTRFFLNQVGESPSNFRDRL